MSEWTNNRRNKKADALSRIEVYLKDAPSQTANIKDMVFHLNSSGRFRYSTYSLSHLILSLVRSGQLERSYSTDRHDTFYTWVDLEEK